MADITHNIDTVIVYDIDNDSLRVYTSTEWTRFRGVSTLGQSVFACSLLSDKDIYDTLTPIHGSAVAVHAVKIRHAAIEENALKEKS